MDETHAIKTKMQVDAEKPGMTIPDFLQMEKNKMIAEAVVRMQILKMNPVVIDAF